MRSSWFGFTMFIFFPSFLLVGFDFSECVCCSGVKGYSVGGIRNDAYRSLFLLRGWVDLTLNLCSACYLAEHTLNTLLNFLGLCLLVWEVGVTFPFLEEWCAHLDSCM